MYDQIGVGNINSDIIASEEEYLNKDEIYESLVSFIVNELQENSQFDELINKYLVLNDEILPDDIVRLLYEQQFLNPEDEDYENWNRGLITTFDLLIKKIQKLEITPADLALDPCSGSAVVTDTATGKVLACVSYPGYDNNRLANQMDNKYYYKIYNNASLPLFNRATQQLSAPGSTFKPVTIIAGLEEGVIDESTMVECDGVFDKVDPPLKCWNHAGHGAVNGVDSALKNSCNDYLCEVSYRLGMIDNDEFSDKQALNYIQEYAKMFDLDEKSGIELTESKPKITDNYAIPSAIGQGTNNFSTVQLGRYVTTLANEGTSFQLSLIDKIDGVETSPKVESQIEINKRSWERVHAGMELYTQSTGIFDGFPISVAGKSGTAQEVKNRPDHGLFIGYAPADDPEIAVAVRIVNGYESGNAVECGKNIFEYYFGITPVRYMMEPEYISQEVLDKEQMDEVKDVESWTVDQTDGSMYFFLDDKIGWRLVVADAAAGSRFYQLEKTADGGDTWEMANQNPFGGNLGVTEGLEFFDKNFGFAGLTGASQSHSSLYVTRDGGTTFTELQLPLETVTELPPLAKELNFTIENYKYCEMPKKKEDILTIKLLTGAGEIQGIRFESKDNGETWAYAGISVE